MPLLVQVMQNSETFHDVLNVSVPNTCDQSEQMCLETTTEDCGLSRTSALIGLSESLWNECIIIIVIIKCEEQYTYNILASPSLKGFTLTNHCQTAIKQTHLA